jgi:phosphoglycolate phosphatase-like HAD superfamily hydrolase
MSARYDACFLDIDGVWHDLELLSSEWSEQLGRALSRRLGGSAEAWQTASCECFAQVWAERHGWSREPLARHADQSHAMLGAMCRFIDRPVLARPEAAQLMREAEVEILSRCSAVVPGTRETLIELARMVALHTASGNLSFRIDALLDGLGVGHLVGVRAGPDVVGAAKNTGEFYRELFARARVPPDRALVVDDDAQAVELVRGLGASAMHVTAKARCSCGANGHIASFSELPRGVA